MKTAANSVLVLLVMLVVGGAARAASPVRDVAAEGAPDRLWVASVVPADDSQPSSERTRIFSITEPEHAWQRPMLIGAGVKDLTHRGSQLVAALKTGEWMFVWPDGRSSGPELPAEGEIVSVGSDGTTVWAVGRVAGGMASVTAATRPATEPSTEPTTRAAGAAATTRVAVVAATTVPVATGPVKLVLFRLDRSTWVGEADLPSEIPTSIEGVSIAIVQGKVYLAAVVEGAAGVYVKDGEHGWQVVGRLKPDGMPAVARAKVLDGGGRPIVWAAGATGAGVMYFGGGQSQWKPAELRVEADLSQPSPRDVAVVAERLKLVFAKDDKLFVQSFDWKSGEPKGKVAPIVPGIAGGIADSKTGMWLNVALMAVLVLVMIGAVRRRGEIEETVQRLEQIPLAPFWVRFVAGFVDLWPVWLAWAYLQVRMRAAGDVEAGVWDPTIIRLNAVAFGVYILHTMVLEMAVGASIGKLLFGLRVVRLDGGRPPAGSMFVRNLMRAVDVGLPPIGAAMILMSPLRQRIGDLAAGTIVVRKTPRGQEAEDEEATGVREE